MAISDLFERDPKKRLQNNIKKLGKLGFLPEYWRWNKEKLLEIDKIDKNLIQDLYSLREKHLINQEEYAKILPTLESIHKDLEFMQKQQNLTQDSEKRESAAVNSLLQMVEKLTWSKVMNEDIFSQVRQGDVRIGDIVGTLYTNSVKNNGDSVLILVGILATRKNLELLSKRIAYQGYNVLTIDLPSQGDSKGEWRLGLMCDFIFTCVDYLRNNFSKKTVIGNRSRVSIIGHSAGAVASMFAALGYSQETENSIYSIFERYAEVEKILINIEKEKVINEERMKRVKEILKEITPELNDLILNSLRTGRFSNGEINSFILLAPPPSFQQVLPKGLYEWIGNRKPENIKKVIDTVINKFWIKYVGSIINKTPVKYSGPDKNKLTYFYLDIPEAKEFMDYIANLKNPVDYMHYILNMEERKEEDRAKEVKDFPNLSPERVQRLKREYEDEYKKAYFVKHYLDKIVRPIPKLYIYGRYDSLLKGILKKGLKISKKREIYIESVYKMLGNAQTIVLPNTSHLLNEKDYLSINMRNQYIQDPAAVRLILQFLEKH